MITRSEHRRWTVATWRLAAPGRTPAAMTRSAVEAAIDVLRSTGADVIALQWIRSRPARAIADELDLPHVWARSHHPRAVPLPGSAIGLSVLTPHRVTAATVEEVGDRVSRWSPRRRVAQIVDIARADRSACALCHTTGPRLDDVRRADAGTPTIVIGQPLEATDRDGRDDGPGASIVPQGATMVSTDRSNPIDAAPPLVLAVFETRRVEGGFATG